MRFFFYGTLLDDSRNAVAAALHGLLRPVGEDSVRGALFAIPDPDGWHPALVPDGNGLALGKVYETLPQFTDDDLARIDAYEDFDPACPDRSLYLRRSVAFAHGGGAQAYVWNRPVPREARPILHGDFRRWLADERLRAFRR